MISRRHLLPTLAAASVGTIVGLAGTRLSRGTSSIRFIGRKTTIVALLNTGTVNVLIALGDQDDDLLANVSGLKTVGKSRIDLVVASHRILVTRSARQHLRLDSTPALSLQTSSSLSPIRGNVTPVTHAISLDLGDDATVHLALASASPDESDADHPVFLFFAEHLGTRLSLANTPAGLRLSETGQSDLVVLPGANGRSALEHMRTPLIVCNAADENPMDAHQIPVHPNDPVIIRLQDGGLTLHEDQLSS